MLPLDGARLLSRITSTSAVTMKSAAAIVVAFDNTVAVPRGMGHRGAPSRGGRGAPAAKVAPNLLLLGVVDDAPAADTDDAEKPGRRGRGRARKDDAAEGQNADGEKPSRGRVPRAKKASTTA